MKHVVIIGPQGAGKGTQAASIAPRYGLIHLATGDLFRALMASDSELSRVVRQYVDRGDLVPDELTAQILFEALDESLQTSKSSGALFDGYPRNRAQAKVLDQQIAARHEKLAAVIHLDVERHVLLDRVAGRADDERRTDDTPDALRRRLEIYFEDTQPLLDLWREQDLVLDIDGDQSIEDVTADIKSALDDKLQPVGRS